MLSQRRSLAPLKMLLFSFHATNSILITFLPLYLGNKGLNGTEIGWVLAIGPLASIFSQPFWGYMSDKYQTVKKTLLFCVSGLLITSVLFFHMNTIIAILFMGAIFYFFTTPIGGLADSLAQRRAYDLNRSFGSIRTWGSIGAATSALIIGELLHEFGVSYMVWPYLFFGVCALLAIFKLTDVKVNADPVQLKDLWIIIHNKPFLIFLLIIMFITISHRANDSFLGLYMMQLGGSERLVGIAWFVGVASEATVFALARVWFKKYHAFIFIIAAGLLYSIRWFVYAGTANPVHIIAFQASHGLTFGLFYVAAFDYISSIIPKNLQSTSHLVFYAVFFGVSGIIGSLLGGALFDSFGGNTLYITIGGFSLFGTIALVIHHILPYGKTIKKYRST